MHEEKLLRLSILTLDPAREVFSAAQPVVPQEGAYDILFPVFRFLSQ
jgi:hypothetical protein